MNSTALFRLKSDITRTKKETVFGSLLYMHQVKCQWELRTMDSKIKMASVYGEGEGCRSSGVVVGKGLTANFQTKAQGETNLPVENGNTVSKKLW